MESTLHFCFVAVLLRCPISVGTYAQIGLLLKYSEQTGYVTVEFNWTCNVVNVVQSQVLYKHILNVEVSEIYKQLHNRRKQCLP
jgi:hypothetical protein